MLVSPTVVGILVAIPEVRLQTHRLTAFLRRVVGSSGANVVQRLDASQESPISLTAAMSGRSRSADDSGDPVSLSCERDGRVEHEPLEPSNAAKLRFYASEAMNDMTSQTATGGDRGSSMVFVLLVLFAILSLGVAGLA